METPKWWIFFVYPSRPVAGWEKCQKVNVHLAYQVSFHNDFCTKPSYRYPKEAAKQYRLTTK